jgi:hypothetical protein
MTRARIRKRLRSPGIDSKESIRFASLCIAWRAGTTNRVIVIVKSQARRIAEWLNLSILQHAVKVGIISTV